MDVKLQCKRCRVIYTLNPGRPLSSYCETCFRVLGRRSMTDFDQWGLNQRYQAATEQMNAGGGPAVDPLRKYLIPKGKS